jgi:hypothetical protein
MSCPKGHAALPGGTHLRKAEKVNLAASIRQRLLNLIPTQKLDFTITLRRYAFERLLYRLGRSDYANNFILKGAMLFVLWSEQPLRTTRDLDLLGSEEMDATTVDRVFRHLLGVETEPDGLQFNLDTLKVDPIRLLDEFQGIRVRLEARLGQIRMPLHIDIGFGDSVWPDPAFVRYPTLLDMPPPRIRAYRRENTIAEKLQAMARLSAINSRMKDFFDIDALAERFSFTGPELAKAISATFSRQGRFMPPETLHAFSEEFASSREKQTQWVAFLRRIRSSDTTVSFARIVEAIREFLQPVLRAVVVGDPFDLAWPPGGPWQPNARHPNA